MAVKPYRSMVLQHSARRRPPALAAGDVLALCAVARGAVVGDAELPPDDPPSVQ